MFCIHQCFYTICCKRYGIPYVRVYPVWSFVFSCVDLMMATIAETCSLIWCLRDNIYIPCCADVFHFWFLCNSEAYLPVNDWCIALYIKHLSDQMRKNINQFLITVYKETKYQLLCWLQQIPLAQSSNTSCACACVRVRACVSVYIYSKGTVDITSQTIAAHEPKWKGKCILKWQ